MTNPDLTFFIKDAHPNAQHCGLLLAFANEKDVVSRVDNDYVRSILDIYRISCGDPPLMKKNASDTQVPQVEKENQPPQPRETGMEPDGKLDTSEIPTPFWDLPEPNYYNLGEIIVFRNANPNGDDFELRPVSVEPEKFCKLVYCDIGVHSKLIYVQNVEDLLGLAEGKSGL